MKLSLLILFVIGYNSLSAQIKFDSLSVEYNIYINKAELNIVSDKIDAANSFYQKAEKIKSLFNADLWNYSLCLASFKDVKCLDNLKILMKRGMSKEFIINAKEFSYLHDSIISFSPKNFTFSRSLRKTIDSLFNEDQKYRLLDSNYLKYKKEIAGIDQSNVNLLIKLFKEHGGYLSEEVLGLNNSCTESDCLHEKLDILILHQNFGNRIYDFTPDIEIAINKGIMDPKRALFLLHRSEGKDRFGLSTGLIKLVYSNANKHTNSGKSAAAQASTYTIGFPKITPQKISEFDKKRKLLGFGTISEFRKKQFFLMDNKKFIFFYFNGLEVYSFDSLKDYTREKNNIVSFK